MQGGQIHRAFPTPYISIKRPTYVMDTYNFTEKIGKATILREVFLYTIDIDSLYTLKPNQASGQYGNNSTVTLTVKDDDLIIQLLEINLTRNDFEFDLEHYLQIKGTAMGK